ERAADEVDDLVDRLLAREPRRLTVAAAALLPGDRGDVDLVLARTKRDPVRRAVRSRRLSNQSHQLGARNLTQVVDDPLGVRLLRSDLGEIAAEQVGDKEPAALVELRAVERAREQLQLRELHALPDIAEDPVE